MTSDHNGANWTVQAQKVAAGIRLRVLEHTVKQNGGYLSQACSSGELFAALFCKILNIAPADEPLIPKPFEGTPGPGRPAVTGRAFNGSILPEHDRFILSPAQYALVLYATLIETGRMSEIGMKEYNKDGGSVEMIGAEHSAGMEVTSGSLGQGISQAGGIALAKRIHGESGRVVVMLSDGECQSGEFWEAVQAISYHKLDNILMFIDRNGYQCDGKMDTVMNLEPFDKRLEAFGANVVSIDGNNLSAIVEASEKTIPGKPLVVICNTDPTCGLELLKDRFPKFHYVRFKDEDERTRYDKEYDKLAEVLGR
jgi:transketolase